MSLKGLERQALEGILGGPLSQTLSETRPLCQSPRVVSGSGGKGPMAWAPPPALHLST